MRQSDPDTEDTSIYKVVVNHEEQYSIWPSHRENPLGWRDAGKVGVKAECLKYIKEVWTDMRPLSLRKKMEEMAKNPPPPPPPPSPENARKGNELVDRLCEQDHPIEVSLRPQADVGLFKQAIDRGYVHIKFTNTRGGTELGVKLDRDACDFSSADFEQGTGMVRILGGLTLNYVKVRCIADVDLKTLGGSGHLEKVDATSQSE